MNLCTTCNEANGTININDTKLCKSCVILMHKRALVEYVTPFYKPVLMSEFDVTQDGTELNFTYNTVMKIQL